MPHPTMGALNEIGARDVVVGGMKSELVLTKQYPNLPYRQQIKTNQGDRNATLIVCCSTDTT